MDGLPALLPVGEPPPNMLPPPHPASNRLVADTASRLRHTPATWRGIERLFRIIKGSPESQSLRRLCPGAHGLIAAQWRRTQGA
jgi:hypothetical protein